MPQRWTPINPAVEPIRFHTLADALDGDRTNPDLPQWLRDLLAVRQVMWLSLRERITFAGPHTTASPRIMGPHDVAFVDALGQLRIVPESLFVELFVCVPKEP